MPEPDAHDANDVHDVHDAHVDDPATTEDPDTAEEPGPAEGPDAADDGEDRDGSPRAMLVERAAARGIQPGPPPRRTGIFVDVDELRSYVGELLRAMLGGYEVDALGNMTFTAQGARIFVTVGLGPLGPHVGVFSITNLGVDLVPDLAAFLLRTNHRMAFGAFSYEPEHQGVWLRHSLLGGTLDGPELRGAILSVASTASQVADVIREKFGGTAFGEESEDVQRSVHPPEPSEETDAVNASGYL